MKERFDDTCANAGFSDRWSCPGCYADMRNKLPGTFACAACGRQVECTLEREPVCISRLVESDDADG